MKGAAIGAGIAATDLSFVSDLAMAATNAVLVDALAGSADWDLNYVDDTIEGFATEFSVNAGDSVSVTTPPSDYLRGSTSIVVRRHGGIEQRKVASIQRVLSVAQTQPAPVRNAALGLVDCGNWAVQRPGRCQRAGAVSGVYVANFVRLDVPGEPANRALFVVRNDGRTSDILVQTSDTTYQAYNRWGGNSLYYGDNQAQFGRAVKVSYNRPVESGPARERLLLCRTAARAVARTQRVRRGVHVLHRHRATTGRAVEAQGVRVVGA